MTSQDVSEATVPELRFPEFSEDWMYKEVEKSFPFIRNGFVGTATPHYRDKGIPYFQGRNVQSGTLSKQADIFISEEFHQSKSKSQLKSGDMLMVQSGHVGHTAVYECEQEANCHAVLVMTPQEDAMPHWFNYLFQSDIGRHEIYKIKTGNTIEHVLSTDVKKIKLATPPPIEQKKIAAFLSAVDDKLVAVEAQLEGWRDYKRGMMQALFSQRLRFKADDGSDFPDWKKVELGEMLDYEQPTKYLVSSTDYDAAFKTPVLTAGKSFILGYTDEVDGIYEKGPVIIFDDFTTASKFVDFRFKAKSSAMKMLSAKEGYNIKFLYEAMQMIRYPLGEHKRHWISEFAIYPISVPSLPEQQKIADALSAIDSKIDVLTERRDATRDFKRGLLQKMFV